MENAIFTVEQTREQLMELSDEKYRQFQSGLIPGKENILGVRMPKLRKLAREINKKDGRQWLLLNERVLGQPNAYYEEIMLRGLVIGEAKEGSIEEYLSRVEAFVPYIDNWAVCDCFCASLKRTKQYKKEVWEFLKPYLQSEEEYSIRFGLVMLLNYYIEEAYLEQLFAQFDRIHHEGYYVKMAVAWAVSICYVKYPKETMVYLKENESLDDFTYNKAIQKTCESYRVPAEEKILLKQMKRKGRKAEKK